MSVIVTGGAGFIGSNLIDRLLYDGHKIVAIDNFDPFYSVHQKMANLASASLNTNFRLINLDIRNKKGVADLVTEIRPETIVHLAARAGVRPSIDDPIGYADVNISGTVNLLNAACSLKDRPKFVYASSSSVYGDRVDAPFRETDTVDFPISPYAATKKACELLAHSFHHIFDLPVTGLRFFTVYGPRLRPDLAIHKFASLVADGRPIPMYGDGSSRRDYTYIDDIVEGVVNLINCCRDYRIYNLGNSHPISLCDMIKNIGEAMGREPLIERRDEQPGDVRQTYADVSRAEAELGYHPKISFQEGISRFVRWHRSHDRIL